MACRSRWNCYSFVFSWICLVDFYNTIQFGSNWPWQRCGAPNKNHSWQRKLGFVDILVYRHEKYFYHQLKWALLMYVRVVYFVCWHSWRIIAHLENTSRRRRHKPSRIKSKLLHFKNLHVVFYIFARHEHCGFINTLIANILFEMCSK